MSIEIEHLRNSLSEQLTLVEAGHTVTITDNGQPVARIVPVDRLTKLEQLVAAGKVRPGRQPKGPAPDPIEAAGPVSDLIDDQRR